MKKLLTELGCGCSFIVGTGIMNVGGVIPFIAGCVFYVLGYYLMDVYRRM